MCVDLSKLNRFVLRERYQSPTPAEAVANITASEAKYFTVMDATKGYHQCPLAEDSQEAKQQTEATREASQRYYNTGVHPLPEIRVGTNVAVQDHRTRLWDTYGVVIAIGPQRQYHVKTQKGSILVRNQRFIRRRVPESITYLQCDVQCTGDPEAMHQYTSELRRLHRWRKPMQRLLKTQTGINHAHNCSYNHFICTISFL